MLFRSIIRFVKTSSYEAQVDVFTKRIMVTEFDEELWYITADSVAVYDDGRLVVKFRDGSEVSISADIWKAA